VSAALHIVLVVALALVLDRALGDPPNRLHPVAWMGQALDAGRRLLCRGGAGQLLLSGALLPLAVIAMAGWAGSLLADLAVALGPAGLLIEAVVLKSTLSVRDLGRAARGVAAALERDDLEEARRQLGRHLVSRPTAMLDAGQVASGAIESVAENLTDALVAPLTCFVVFGLPGALAYRALNTADTMLGYREGALEYFGKAAARLDDLVNLVPARLAALAIVLAAGRAAGAAWAAMARDHAITASPNAGWTMAAMAGALGVTLHKPGAYRLGGGRPPDAGDIERSARLMGRAAGLAALGLLALRVVIGNARSIEILAMLS
jgi:adenosylcobinamide-phosphate synthase